MAQSSLNIAPSASMPYSFSLFELTFSQTFTPPRFEVASAVGRILEGLYAALSPEFKANLQLADFQGLAGTSMGDVGAKVRMFDGRVAIDITPEKLLVAARGLRERTDYDIAVRVATRAHEVVASLLPNLTTKSLAVVLNGWMKSDSPSDPKAADILASGAPAKTFETVLGETTSYALRMRLRNEVEQYSCEFVCDDSAISSAELFISFTLTVEERSEHATLAGLAALGENSIGRWFNHIGIPVASPGAL